MRRRLFSMAARAGSAGVSARAGWARPRSTSGRMKRLMTVYPRFRPVASPRRQAARVALVELQLKVFKFIQTRHLAKGGSQAFQILLRIDALHDFIRQGPEPVFEKGTKIFAP